MKMIGSTQWPVVCVTSSQEEGAIHSLMAVIYKHPYGECYWDGGEESGMPCDH